MTNVNYICGMTVKGELITFDGFRVESYSIYEDDAEGTLVDLLFKSGSYVTVYAYMDDGDEIIDSLCDCRIALSKNPDLLAKRFPIADIACNTPKNKDFFFDGNTVEYYTTDEFVGENLVELHFASGHVVEVCNELDEDIYPGESVVTLVDDCICRYYNENDDGDDDE